MCQAKIWVRVKGEEREVARDITQLEVKGDSLLLKTFFEAPKEIKGRIKEIDFLKGKVIIEADEFPQ
ncbi:MAG: RNA-binding protein [Caldimicrobium thiodismutans]|uniref:RNA-binding protein n=1 Tax=Caldimicrobium thiodismutans TaxID=1653476 RepID=A0A2N7PKU5_9BACT|nr:MAG: RNA-binding protein [Caldimicrobium thiodismutans]